MPHYLSTRDVGHVAPLLVIKEDEEEKEEKGGEGP